MFAQYLKEFAVAFVTFMIIDLIWLGFVAKDLYKKYLGFIMSPTVNWPAAILFYVLFIMGIVFFVLHPALEKDSVTYALLAGAFFGLVTYATYDLTNLATLKDWPLTITIIDLIWGSTLSALTASGAFLIIKQLFS